MTGLLNQAAVEALCSATYLENYLESMENMPNDLQRIVSQLRQLDASTNETMLELKQVEDTYRSATEASSRKASLYKMQRVLIRCQDMGDEKLALIGQFIDCIENRSRQLEQDLENLEPGATLLSTDKYDFDNRSTMSGSSQNTQTKAAKNSNEDKPEKSYSAAAKRQRRQRPYNDSREEEKKEKEEKPKKKKKRKTKKEKAQVDQQGSPVGEAIDPDEPTYCSCKQVSYGEMICCDNDDCPIEWYHFNCVELTHKPKGKWYCPRCRGDKPTVKRHDIK